MYAFYPYAEFEAENIPVVDEHIPRGELTIRRGARVDANNGPAGMVAEFLFMFWSHRSFATQEELIKKFLDPDLSNPDYKAAAQIDFLNDQLGSGEVVFLVATIAIQMTLCGLLIAWIGRQGEAAPAAPV